MIKRKVRLKRNIRRTVLILAASVVASAAIAQQSNPYGERNRLIALKEITWSETAAARYSVKLPVPAKEHIWDHLGSVSSVNFSPDARIAVTGSWKEGRAYDIVTGKLLHTFLPKRPSYVIIAAVAPDGKTSFTGAGDGTTREWDLKTGKMLREWGHWKDVEDLDFSPGGGRYVATSAADRTAKLWDRETGEKIVEMPHNGTVLPLDFTPDGVKLMTGSVDKFARLWDLRTGQAIHEWQHEGEVGAVDASPDGRYGLSGAQDGTARLFDIETGDEVHRWTHEGAVYDVHFSPDAKLAVTAGGDNTAKVWRVEDKKLTQTFSHGGIVSYARFTPDGRFVLTGSRDKTAVLWVAETGRKMATLKLGDGVRSMAFSLDGRLALIGSFDKTARLVDLGKYFDLERTASYFRARLAQILNHNISQYIGPPPTPPVIAPRGEEERDSAYRRRITAENGRYKTQVREYREKQSTFPVWRRNQIVEYTFYSVFGTPVVKDVRHDATDGRTVVVIGSNSALAGGIERNLLLKENVPQQNAAAMKNVLSQGTPFIRLAFENGRLRFSEAIIEANGRSYRGEFVDDIDSFEVFASAQPTSAESGKAQ
ncbi:MAG: WD40 repeat domain-containing protein [Alphaproteobacteria bacterium]|jgi:WD40 repeat protein|nr:WD40 repeat domain-containing protein [Alphaproteobacteria bacterium]